VNLTPIGEEAIENSPRAAWTSGGIPLVAFTDWFKDDDSHVRPSRLYDTDIDGYGAAPIQVDGHGGAHVSTFAPAIATAGRDALVAWQDQSYGAGRIELAHARAQGTVGRRRRVDDGRADGYPRARPAIAVGGGYAVVAWEDSRGGRWQIRTARAPLTALLRLAASPR
jgi:hypothetical protein